MGLEGDSLEVIVKGASDLWKVSGAVLCVCDIAVGREHDE
jgi:hypothetical protein